LQTLREWIDALPRDLISSTPWLRYWLGTALIPIDQVAARKELEPAYTDFESRADASGQLHAAAGIMEAHYYEYRSLRELDPWIVVMERLLAIGSVFPSAEAELRAYASLLLAIFYREPKHALLPVCLERIDSLLQAEIDANRRVSAGTWLLQYYTYANQVEPAQRLIESVSLLVKHPGVTPLTQLFWWARLAHYHLFQADCAGADGALDRAEALTSDLGAHAGKVLVYSYRVDAGLLRHDAAETERCAAELMRAARPGQPFHDALINFARYRVAAQRGDSEEMLAAIRLTRDAFERGGNLWAAVEFSLPYAYALIEFGDIAAAQRQIEETARLISGTFLQHYSYELLLLGAYAALRTGDGESAQRLLEKGLGGASGGGLFHLLLAGQMVPALCEEALRAGVAVATVQQLVRRHGLLPASPDVEDWPWPIRIETLGRFALYKDGKPVAFAGKVQQKPLELLKAVVALGATEVDAGTVKQLLWADAEGDAAQNAFDITLHRLRKLLAHDGAIELQHGKLGLNPQLCWVDAVALERLIDRAAAWQEIAERVFRLYRGHFLAQDGEQPWLIAPRNRLRSKFMRALCEAGAQLEHAGDWSGAAALYQRGLELDTLAEPLYRRLMVCHQRRGDRAEAMNVYRRCRDSLSIVLGTRPSTETENLYQALRKS